MQRHSANVKELLQAMILQDLTHSRLLQRLENVGLEFYPEHYPTTLNMFSNYFCLLGSKKDAMLQVLTEYRDMATEHIEDDVLAVLTLECYEALCKV